MLTGQEVWEYLLMCSHGDIPSELLVSSKLNNLLDMVDADNTDAPRHERLGTKLSHRTIGTEAVAGVQVSEGTTRVIALILLKIWGYLSSFPHKI